MKLSNQGEAVTASFLFVFYKTEKLDHFLAEGDIRGPFRLIGVRDALFFIELGS
jgi:hypothetical protein